MLKRGLKYSVLYVFVLLALALTAASCAPKDVVETVVVTEIVEGKVVEKVVTATPEPEVATLKVWMQPFGGNRPWDDTMVDIVGLFEAAHPGVEVEYQTISWETWEEKFITSLVAGNAPDVANIYHEMAPPLYEKGLIRPIDDYITANPEFMADQMWPDRAIYNGTRYGLSSGGANRALFFNKGMFDEAGVPYLTEDSTWDDFLAAAQALTKDLDDDGTPDQWGYAAEFGGEYFGVMNNTFYPWIWQAGGDLISEDCSQVIFNSDDGVQALQFLYDMMYEYEVISPDASGYKEMDIFPIFGEEKAAMVIFGVWNDVVLDTDYPEIDYGVITSLQGPDGDYGTFFAADYWAITSDSEVPDLAWEWMKFWNTSEIYDLLADEYGMEAAGIFSHTVSGDAWNSAIENADRMKGMPLCLGSKPVIEELWRAQQIVLSGQDTNIQQVLDDAAGRAQEEMEQIVAESQGG